MSALRQLRRLALVSGSYPPTRCGIGDHVACLAARLAERGLEIDIITSGQDEKVDQEGAVRVHRIVSSWAPRALPGLARRLRRLEPDVVHLHYPSVGYGRSLGVNLLPGYLRWRHGRPGVVLSVHEFGTFTPLGKLRIVASTFGAAGLCATEPGNLASLRRWLPWRTRGWHLLPVGSSIPEAAAPVIPDRAAARAELGLADPDFAVAFFGFLSRSKGVKTLVRAVALALPECPRLRLVLLAAREPRDRDEAPYVQEVEDALRELHLQDRTIWTGYLEAGRVSRYLRAVDGCALPFRDGVSPRRTTVLAAASAGLPIVSTHPARGRVPACGAEASLLLVPPEDPLALSRALIRLVADEELRATLGRGALDLARGQAWPAIVDRALEIYTVAARLNPPRTRP